MEYDRLDSRVLGSRQIAESLTDQLTATQDEPSLDPEECCPRAQRFWPSFAVSWVSGAQEGAECSLVALVDIAVIQRCPGENQAMEMPEYGKHGKPRSRLPTLPTLFGNPFGIPTFPRPRRLDSCLLIPPNSKSWLPQGACNGCLRSTA